MTISGALVPLSIYLFILISYFMCLSVLFGCMSVYHAHVWYLQKPGEAISALGTVVAHYGDLLYGC